MFGSLQCTTTYPRKSGSHNTPHMLPVVHEMTDRIQAFESAVAGDPVYGSERALADDPGNPTVDFHGEKRSNQTHASTSDADALPARKGAGKEPR